MTSYVAEVTRGERTHRSRPFATPERAAAALPRLLAGQLWQHRPTAGEPLPIYSARIVEDDDPAGALERHGPVDLADYSEGLRRRLYDQVVTDFFAPPLVADAASWPPYGPEDAGLTVFFQRGRWFATWERLELAAGTEEETAELLRIYSTSRGIVYQEV